MTENELRSVLSVPWLPFYPNPNDATLTYEDNAQCAGFYRSVFTVAPAASLSVSPYWAVKGSPRMLTVKPVPRMLTVKPVRRVLTIVRHN